MKKDKTLMMGKSLVGTTLVMLGAIFALLHCCYIDARYIKELEMRKKIRGGIRDVLKHLRDMMKIYKQRGLVKEYNEGKMHKLDWPAKIWG